MASKIKFKINNDKFSDLIEKLDDLTKIEDTIKMKIDSENILIYSMLSSGQTMLAFKNYLLSTKDYLDYGDELEHSFDIIINISVIDGKVLLSEKAAWELEIESFDDDRNASLMLNKKFLSCINDSVDKIEFSIFENFMLIKDTNSNLMLSFEQDFSDD